MKVQSYMLPLLAGLLLLAVATPIEAGRGGRGGRGRPDPVCPYPDLDTADVDGNGIMDFVDAACPCSDGSSVYTKKEREAYIDCVKDTAKDAYEKNCLGTGKDVWKNQKKAAKDGECYINACPYPDLDTADVDGNGIMDFVDAACPCSDDSSPDKVYTEEEREAYIDCVKNAAKDAYKKNCLGTDKDVWKNQKKAAKDGECYTPYADDDDEEDEEDNDGHDNDDDRRRMLVRRLLRALREATSGV